MRSKRWHDDSLHEDTASHGKVPSVIEVHIFSFVYPSISARTGAKEEGTMVCKFSFLPNFTSIHFEREEDNSNLFQFHIEPVKTIHALELFAQEPVDNTATPALVMEAPALFFRTDSGVGYAGIGFRDFKHG